MHSLRVTLGINNCDDKDGVGGTQVLPLSTASPGRPIAGVFPSWSMTRGFSQGLGSPLVPEMGLSEGQACRPRQERTPSLKPQQRRSHDVTPCCLFFPSVFERSGPPSADNCLWAPVRLAWLRGPGLPRDAEATPSGCPGETLGPGRPPSVWAPKGRGFESVYLRA